MSVWYPWYSGSYSSDASSGDAEYDEAGAWEAVAAAGTGS